MGVRRTRTLKGHIVWAQCNKVMLSETLFCLKFFRYVSLPR